MGLEFKYANVIVPESTRCAANGQKPGGIAKSW